MGVGNSRHASAIKRQQNWRRAAQQANAEVLLLNNELFSKTEAWSTRDETFKKEVTKRDGQIRRCGFFFLCFVLFLFCFLRHVRGQYWTC